MSPVLNVVLTWVEAGAAATLVAVPAIRKVDSILEAAKTKGALISNDEEQP